MDNYPFIFIVTLLGSVAIFSVFAFYRDEQKKLHWREFAKANGLRFIPGQLFSGNTRVEGRYGAYYVTLQTIQVSHGKSSKTFTAITLSDYPTDYPIQSADKANPLKAMDFKEITSLLDPNRRRYALNGSITITSDELKYQEAGLQTDPQHLKLIVDYLSHIAVSYPQVAALGSEAIPALLSLAGDDDTLKPVATQLIHDIGQFTTTQLQWRLMQLLCQDCLTTFAWHTESLGFLKSVTYIGCRLCKQSRRYFQAERVVLAVDNTMQQEINQEQDILWINWLQRRDLYDFNEVHILNATDEEVERLAVQIGNDTDPQRVEHYEHMACTVAPTCHLTENTMRILRHTFGQVAVK